MLRTNTKQVRVKIQKYIIENFFPDDYTSNPPQEFGEIAKFILQTFRSEKYSLKEDFRFYHNSEALAFEDWAAGLPKFDGGCGVNCFRSIFEACGYEWRTVASGKMFSCYTIERRKNNA